MLAYRQTVRAVASRPASFATPVISTQRSQPRSFYGQRPVLAHAWGKGGTRATNPNRLVAADFYSRCTPMPTPF
eukprot:364277-Chlamydomonas_euryale.AAC.3